MELGAFSISLSVKDIQKSKSFYEKFGFKAAGGDISQNWLIMRNKTVSIGLFQGMFDKNMLTFNPGWDSSAKKIDSYTDIRELQTTLKERGIEFVQEAKDDLSGPASFVVIDPDGNPILVDQHI